MNGHLQVYCSPRYSSPTHAQAASDVFGDEVPLFSWEATLTMPEDDFFDVQRVMTITDNLLVGSSDE